ncbi:MAG: hypothetical protein K8R35_09995, partial [Bacteroidales bacterium]|nr:hypothetical protein [Bacteroidales bacterium]
VFTDRSVYAVNEQIYFRADLVAEGLPEDKVWSSVLYAELVSTSGTSLSRAKFDISDQACFGMLSIPASALTGNYFLKCYTRWMRNAGAGNFSYTQIKIINPFRPEVDNQPNGGEEGMHYSYRNYITGLLECSIPQRSYKNGEEIRLDLSVSVHIRLQKVQCCIIVVPLFAVDTLKGQLMSIAPKKIRRIDVINDVYVKGSVNYGGVINIITLDGDMAGIDLPAGSYFFDYLALHPSGTPIERLPDPGDLVPDSRNTMLWIPDLLLERGIVTDVVFKAPAYPGEYVVLVRGMDITGEVLSATVRFVVE